MNEIDKVLTNPSLTSSANYVIRYTSFKIGATLGPPLNYFSGRKRGHHYAHFTVALINHTACRFSMYCIRTDIVVLTGLLCTLFRLPSTRFEKQCVWPRSNDN